MIISIDKFFLLSLHEVDIYNLNNFGQAAATQNQQSPFNE